MIEAVSSVLLNAQSIRSSTDRVDVAAASNAVSEGVDVSKVPVAPYISPYISIDNNSNQAVLQIRDSNTGDIVNQFPSEARLEQIRRQEIERQRLATNPDAPPTTTASARQTTAQQAQQVQDVNNFSSAQTQVQAQSFASSTTGVSDIGSAQIASAALASAVQASAGTSSSVAVSA